MPIPDTYVANVIIHFPCLEQFYCSLESQIKFYLILKDVSLIVFKININFLV